MVLEGTSFSVGPDIENEGKIVLSLFNNYDKSNNTVEEIACIHLTEQACNVLKNEIDECIKKL